MELFFSVKDGVEFEGWQIGVIYNVDHGHFLTEARGEGGEGCISKKIQENSSLYS